MTAASSDLWTLVESRPDIDPNDLASAVAAQAARPSDDYRTLLLMHDSLMALESHWGPRFDSWLCANASRERLQAIRQTPFDEIGFPSLRRRLMEKTSADKVRQFFEYLGQRV